MGQIKISADFVISFIFTHEADKLIKHRFNKKIKKTLKLDTISKKSIQWLCLPLAVSCLVFPTA